MIFDRGLLPFYLLFVSYPNQVFYEPCFDKPKTSTLGLIHTVVCYLGSPPVALRQFSGDRRPPPTQLLAHVYAVKNIYTCAIRIYAAFELHNRALYDLATLSYLGVLWLFATELWIWRTVRYKEAVFPFFNAGVAVIWLLVQRNWYLYQ